MRKNLLQTYVWSVTFYRNGTSTIASGEKKNLLLLKVLCYRIMRRISQKGKPMYEEVLRRAEKERIFFKQLRLRWEMSEIKYSFVHSLLSCETPGSEHAPLLHSTLHVPSLSLIRASSCDKTNCHPSSFFFLLSPLI